MKQHKEPQKDLLQKEIILSYIAIWQQSSCLKKGSGCSDLEREKGSSGLLQLPWCYSVQRARQCLSQSSAHAYSQNVAEKTPEIWTVKNSRQPSRQGSCSSVLWTDGMPLGVSTWFTHSSSRSQERVWLVSWQGTLCPPASSWDSCKAYWSTDWHVLRDRKCYEVRMGMSSFFPVNTSESQGSLLATSFWILVWTGY